LAYQQCMYAKGNQIPGCLAQNNKGIAIKLLVIFAESVIEQILRNVNYGYKNHINADHATKLVQDYEVTDASVHDSQVFDELLDHTQDAFGNKRAVYADSAYRSNDTEEKLDKDGITSQICEKGTRAAALTDEQKESNKKKSKVRARVEHVFGAQEAMGGHFVRTIGLLRARVKIGMMNLVYNMIRLVQLLRRDMKMTG